MTPTKKANELHSKYYDIIPFINNGGESEYQAAKQCALITVDEIIKAHIHNEGIRHLKWWEEVKQEIEKI
jgi:hypothetical protein